MIKLTRTRTPDVIPPIFSSTERVALNEKLLLHQKEILNGRATKHEWNSDVWGKGKAQLLVESANKCAYCEAPLKAVAYGDVEHYRPKSVYWWLAYSYENYLASCTLCNQAFKKDFFPIGGPAAKGPRLTKNTTEARIKALAPSINPDPLDETLGMSYAAFSRFHKKEVALLPNPYYQDPELLFCYSADETLMEVEIFVKADVENAAAIQQAVLDNYGLNRLELKQLRYEWYNFYSTQKMVLSEPTISDALRAKATENIKSMTLSKSHFAGMIRYFEKQG